MTDKDELEKYFLDRISEPPEDSDGVDHVFSWEYERKKQQLIRRASNGCSALPAVPRGCCRCGICAYFRRSSGAENAGICRGAAS